MYLAIFGSCNPRLTGRISSDFESSSFKDFTILNWMFASINFCLFTVLVSRTNCASDWISVTRFFFLKFLTLSSTIANSPPTFSNLSLMNSTVFLETSLLSFFASRLYWWTNSSRTSSAFWRTDDCKDSLRTLEFLFIGAIATLLIRPSIIKLLE